jgi:hypothetical protein
VNSPFRSFAGYDASAGDQSGTRFVEHLEGDGPIIIREACKLKFEGLCRSDATSHIIRPVEDVAQGENPASPAMIRIKEEGMW